MWMKFQAEIAAIAASLDITTAVLFSVLGGLAGYFIGHRLELHRDKRKEYNEIAVRMRTALHRAAGSGQPTELPASDVEWEILLDYQWWPRRWALRWARKDWLDSFREFKQDDIGQITYPNEVRNNAITARLLRHLKRK